MLMTRKNEALEVQKELGDKKKCLVQACFRKGQRTEGDYS